MAKRLSPAMQAALAHFAAGRGAWSLPGRNTGATLFALAARGLVRLEITPANVLRAVHVTAAGRAALPTPAPEGELVLELPGAFDPLTGAAGIAPEA